MKWLLVKLVLIAYILSLVVFVTFFPEIGVTEEDRSDAKCKRKIDRIIQNYELALNQTVNNLTRNRETVNSDAQIGPGAFGLDVDLTKTPMSPAERQEWERLLAQYDYDAFISDMVSIYRVLPDNRPDVCKTKQYGNLPEVSIIIPFRDERLSVLLRTVHSILQNTPDDLLAEIILIDDGSKTDELKSRLEVHVQSLSKVNLIRLNPSAGLMVARQTGIDRCKADYFITMDCHIEVIRGWLEPLLYRLKQNPKACLSPNVGLLKRDTFGVDFTTRWTFQRFPMFVFTLEEAHSFYKPDYLAKINRSEPLPTGINQGMVIAMKKSWFKQLGGFDTGMRVWGGEQIELSVKVWTCGGAVEIIPCSYIAHLFKTRLVWENMGLSKIINALRFAEVWMDEYKEMLHQYWPTARRELRNEDTGFCIEKESVLGRCSMFKAAMQFFEHTEEYHIRHDGFCLFPASMANQDSPALAYDDCYVLGPQRSQWLYTMGNELLHKYTNTCLTVSTHTNIPELIFDTCAAKPNQRWTWKLWND
ncbi:polypeptide N-acetylgalactosaminyltransferase 4-like isoform X2 [Mercenaria mercenaria]|uniref:polypeptide N-acetylgalactosaminyltransferase 4-like isoform X2 n=1 Tax=Mercenaria mercenaria TaxID=6596 RepID=UPI00234F4D28|nr:polypeptide N-acetylgalactosaminyltransferase 4-like isoform X2 [Mercenaria mercenaria]